MKTYRCRDTLGRVWEVTHEAVKGDYIQAMMQMDDLSYEEAKEYVESQEDISFWWYEEILPYPSIIMEIGDMVKDISKEEKEDVLTIFAVKGWMEEIE